ncbi:MAG: hypothetical protein CFE43_17915 [Burkholderiales bacterium PBB3]|nr:MAG: hypothetical protein CFE43_17915 [Burkholderiales bacterium PBB3]
MKALDFPIDRLITTGSVGQGRSPNGQALEALQPVTFVDDCLPYVLGMEAHMHMALTVRDANGSPNLGEQLRQAGSTHGSLLEFSRWWVG